MSSWGIRMELLRIAMHAPCHQGEGSLHHAHANGPPCNVSSSPDIPHPEFCPADIPPSPNISHPALAARMGKEGVSTSLDRHIRFSDSAYPESFAAILHSADSTYLESFAAILHSAAVFS